MKIHICSSKKILKNYDNVDLDENANAKYKIDARNLDLFDDNSVDEIYASHILEHFQRYEIFDVLKEWNRILKVGGILRIAVPDFNSCVNVYNKNHNIFEVLGLIIGGQNNEYDNHYNIFNFEIIKEFLENTGYTDIQKYDTFKFLPDDFFHKDKLKKQYYAIKNTNRVVAMCKIRRQRGRTFSSVYSAGSSLLFKKQIIKRIGYYDSVRFSGDTEFITRIQSVYGRKSIKKVPQVLYIAAKRRGSLTSKLGLNIKRQQYKTKFAKWHQRSKKLYIGYKPNRKESSILNVSMIKRR